MSDETANTITITEKKKRTPKIIEPLQLRYDTKWKYEICIDEVGRGPLFGRVYIAAVVLPYDCTFDNKDVKDSKKFSSKKKIQAVSDYIREHALLWHIHYIDATIIDRDNILQAVYQGMHSCIDKLINKITIREQAANNTAFKPYKDILLMIDGDRFSPYCVYDDESGMLRQLPHVTIEQGDAKYVGIAAASIIAKVEHDKYISELCVQYPVLNERYQLSNNVGYGTKHHIDGIRTYGITQWHRRSFGPCKTAEYAPIEEELPSV